MSIQKTIIIGIFSRDRASVSDYFLKLAKDLLIWAIPEIFEDKKSRFYIYSLERNNAQVVEIFYKNIKSKK